MAVHCRRFNLYLLLVVISCALTACRTSSTPEEKAKKKATTVLSVFVETKLAAGNKSQTISVPRGNPIEITVETEPFLTEAFVSEAKVISVIEGFALSIKFDRRGAWLLEQYAAGNRGRRLAVRAQFGKGLDQTRWLAAPRITNRISDGVLTFTPDATREETDEIVQGLNNVAKKVQDKSPW
jgi:hypothetical protein